LPLPEQEALMDIEANVAQHYTHGRLEAAILDALRAAGKNVDALSASDLSAADEFHLGWHAVTIELARDLALEPGLELLDLGSGIGGPARYFAEAHGCRVTGVDLTAEFVNVANALTARCRLDGLATFVQGSVLALPFEDARFDRATLIHVGMNIENKAGMFAEALRALRPGGAFLVYDIMRRDAGRADTAELPYPQPWAQTAETSFVEPLEAYRRLLEAAGFTIESERDRRDQVLELGRAMRAQVAVAGVPPLGLHVLMGPASRERLGNVMSALERGSLSPIEIVARRPG
jgi:ubiquinone/menaquinone biosynthesis C-methylase UbiE